MTASSDGSRVPPQDVAAERAIIGAMMLSRDAIADVVEVLRPVDFYRPAHQATYEAAVRLYGKGEPVDQITLLAELVRTGHAAKVGGAPFLVELIDATPTAASAGYYARIVADKATLRRLAEAATRVLQRAETVDRTGGDVREIVDEAAAAVHAAAAGRLGDDCVRLEDLLGPTLDEIEAVGRGGVGGRGVPTGFADLDALTNGLHPGQLVIVAARPSVGKALAVDTVLPTPTGWRTMGTVQAGDYLLDEHGEPCRVVATTEVMHGRPCYSVLFSDGTKIVADADHLWLTEARAGRCAESPARGAARLRSTAEMAATVAASTNRTTHAVRVCAPLRLAEVDLPVPPYTLGIWLAEGAMRNARLTLNALDAADIEAAITEEGVDHHRVPSAAGRGAVGVTVPGLKAALRELGLDSTRHIPTRYLRASEQQRRALLAGLLDGDGYCSPGGTVEFVSISETLARDVAHLACTLGYRPTRKVKDATLNGRFIGKAWRVWFTPRDVVFRVNRKAARQVIGSSRRTSLRYVTAVQPINSLPVRCVQVDSASGMYLASEACIPTHNSTLGLDFARHAAITKGLPAVVFSLEMSRSEVVMRMLAAEARINLQAMRTGRLADDDWGRLARRMGEVAGAPLFIDDSPSLSMVELRAKARRLAHRHGLRLVIVDYLQLLATPGSRVENRQQEVSAISRSLKLLAKELDVPVVAISQLNRSPEQRADKRPMLSDLRESGSLEQDPDIVILLYREDLYDQQSPRAGEADLIVAKHRNGPCATVTLAFQGHFSRFVDMKPA